MVRAVSFLNVKPQSFQCILLELENVFHTKFFIFISFIHCAFFFFPFRTCIVTCIWHYKKQSAFFPPHQTIAKYHYGLCSFCEIPEKSATHLRLDVYHKQAQALFWSMQSMAYLARLSCGLISGKAIIQGSQE